MFDVIVIGLGGIGSAALWHLARRGMRTLGLDQFGIAHDRGSSHGQTRLIRKAYFEHPDYVPLVHRAYEGWKETENLAGERLFHRTGLLLIGRADGRVVSGVRQTADVHDLDIESLARDAVRSRFPQFQPGEGMAALYEKDAGYLAVEACVRAHAKLAVDAGAVIHPNEGVESWCSDGAGVEVRTKTDRFRASKLVVCAGPWSGELLGDLELPLAVRRKVMMWFRLGRDRTDRRESDPVFCFDTPDGFFYGFPDIDGTGMKIGEHSGGRAIEDPADLDRRLHASDVEPVARFVTRHLPRVDPKPTRHSVCMYTMTPDEHFVVGAYPRRPNVVVAAGFSGHGFKFAPVIGSAVADLAMDGSSALPVGFLDAARWNDRAV